METISSLSSVVDMSSQATKFWTIICEQKLLGGTFAMLLRKILTVMFHLSS